MKETKTDQNQLIHIDSDPYQAAEVENTVLGSIFLEPDLAYETNLTVEHFSRAANRIIFGAIQKLAEQNVPVDVMTVTQKLLENEQIENVGGVSYLTELAESVPTTANFPYYQAMLIEQYKKRLMTRAASDYLANPTEETAEKMYSTFIEAQEMGQKPSQSKIEVLGEIFDEIYEDAGELTGISSGLMELDRMTGGWQSSDLIVIAGRPSMGKTAYALGLAKACCEQGGVADIFSLEMPQKQLIKRFLSSIGNIEGSKWRNSFKLFTEQDKKRAQYAMDIYNKWAINIHDNPRQTVADIRAAVRKTKREHPGRKHIVVIDYLQLITPIGKFERHDLAVGHITRELKQMARQFDVPVMLLSQLSRAVEQRQDKRPMMSDLRDSGSIEQDADIVSFLYRDDYYNSESEAKNIVEVILAKQRNGPVGTVQLAFVKEYSQFLNLERRFDG
ncbi:replicative DNA helicase [Bacillus badius]|uniref:Replicative DNA helicase n=1 Tax=Bacillus badius TaxID=1455 RepID=A0ABR5AP88_BACBA|nr:replicative DNA helicase [Bacillus badius]KIL74166.1 Replicative DNA helicase (DnaB) [Bacillus badius]MED4718160.1 replicative DNA helicase [Bacillus badius]